MHTIAGLLHADHREPSLDYEILMKARLHLTHNVQECWSVSPAYDLTFSSGPSGEHATMVMGEGRNPKTEHLLGLANLVDIKKNRASEIIDQVGSVVRQ